MKLITTLTFLLVSISSFGQVSNFIGKITNHTILLEVDKDEMPVVTTEIILENKTPIATEGYLDFRLNEEGTTLEESQIDKCSISPEKYHFKLAGGKKLTATFNLEIDTSINNFDGKQIHFDLFINSGGEEKKFNKRLKVNLVQFDNTPYSLQEFKDTKEAGFEVITNVTVDKNLFTVYGYNSYKGNHLQKRNVVLKKNETLAIRKLPFRPAISILTTPIKVRPGESGRPTETTTSIRSIGLNFNIPLIRSERYFSNGRKSEHAFSIGILGAPSVEKLDSINTNGFISPGNTSNQFFISTGLTINYSFNNVCLTFIPAGVDISTSSTGDQWIHDGNLWWGFGIGINPRIFSSRINRRK